MNNPITQAASIGIIGGADGPTAIFVTSSINWQRVCILVSAIAAAVLAVALICRKAKKK